MDSAFGTTLWLTFKLAAITTGFLLIIGVPLAFGLSRMRSRIKPWLEALISMPLVLPPTVLGFYLLLAFSPGGVAGTWFDQQFGWRFVFTFEGLVLGSILYSLPFMVQPVQAGFEAFPRQLEEASYVLGKSKWETFIRIILPNVKSALISGTVLAFAHTIGEFGVVLMIGGNIPGRTRVASIAIYDEVESMNYALANRYALVLIGFTFAVLLLVYMINRRTTKSVVL